MKVRLRVEGYSEPQPRLLHRAHRQHAEQVEPQQPVRRGGRCGRERADERGEGARERSVALLELELVVAAEHVLRGGLGQHRRDLELVAWPQLLQLLRRPAVVVTCGGGGGGTA